jgi:predicted dehydrogenase
VTQRVALIGAGDWARTALAPAVAELPDAQIVACVDPDRARARVLAEAFRVRRTFGSVAELASSGTPVDVAVISTPDRHHADAIEAAFALGAAVYCEKPLASSWAEARRLVQLAAAHPRPAAVGFTFHYSAAVQQLKADLVGGVLGRPWLIETQERNSQFHPTSGRPMTWKGDPAHAPGGALVEYGALGTLAAGWVLAGGFPGIRIVVHGSSGTGEVVLDDARPVAETYRRYDLSGRVVDARDVDPVPRHEYARRQLADLLAVSAGRRPEFVDTLPTLADGAAVQALLDRALEIGSPPHRSE